MSAESKHFDAGVLAGRLESARQFGVGKDFRVASLEAELRDLLKELGVRAKGGDLHPFRDLRNQMRQMSGNVCSTCFEVGMDFTLLQAHLKIYSIATMSQLPSDVLSNAIDSLRPLVGQMRLGLAEINAPEEAQRFLIRVSEALGKADKLFSASADLFDDSEVLKVRIRSYLESQEIPPAPSIGHLHAASPLLRLLAILGGLLGAILLVGGIYLAVAQHFADTKFNLFGNQFSSTSVGVSMAFIGAVLIVLTFRRIIRAIERLAALPND